MQFAKASRKAGLSIGKKKSGKKKRSATVKDAGQSAGQPTASVPSRQTTSGSRPQTRTPVIDAIAESMEQSENIASKAPLYVMGALHIIDASLGISCIVYGSMAHVIEVTAVSISYGSILFIGFLSGSIGFFSKSCNKNGLLVSALVGLLTAVFDFAAFVAIVVAWDSFVVFLSENSEELLLNDSSLSTISGLQILFAIIFIALFCVEGYRSYAMVNIWRQLLQDAPFQSSFSRSKQKSGNWLANLLGLNYTRKNTEDFVMFDDQASMESSLLWSNSVGRPATEDYLDFVTDHDRGLEKLTTNVSMPAPPTDRTDY